MLANVMQLIAALGAATAEERCRAAEELARLGEEGRAAAVALVRACGDAEENVREAAVAALEGLGAPQADDVPKLGTLLAAPAPDVGYWAATLLGRLEADASAAAPELAAAVDQAEQAVRERAAWALGKIGPPAKAAQAALQKASASDRPRLARLATEALQQIGSR